MASRFDRIVKGTTKLRMSVARNTSYNLAASAAAVIGALVTIPIYIRLIGPGRYGVLAIAWALLAWFGLFDFGLRRAVAYRLASMGEADRAEQAHALWTALAINLVSGLVGGAALWLGGDWAFAHLFKVGPLKGEILAGLPFVAIAVPVTTTLAILRGAMQGREMFLPLNIISASTQALFQILPVIIAWLVGPSLPNLLAGALAARLVGVLLFGTYIYANLIRGTAPRVNRREARTLLGYGGWVTVSSVFSPMLSMVDRFVMGAMIGAVEVGIYSVPLQFSKQLQGLPAAITTALFPRLSAADDAGGRAMNDMATRSLAALATFPVIGAIFLMQFGLDLFVGRHIGEAAAPVGRLLLLGFWFNAFAIVSLMSLQASGRPDLVGKLQIPQVPLYFAALYFGLRWYGIEGAGLALVLRSAVDYGLLYGADRRRSPAWLLLAANVVLIVCAIWLAGLWPITDPRWWLAAAALGGASLVLAWTNLPLEAKRRGIDLLRILMRSPQRTANP
ncbi:MAG: flippase [Caulobacteraceae bacterium]